jgi:hypothetical protein
VKVAFVVGFFNPVKRKLETLYKDELNRHTLQFLGKESPYQAFDLPAFKARFFELAGNDSPDPILVLAAETRGFEWVTSQLEGAVNGGRSRAGDRKQIHLDLFQDAQNADPVLEALKQFWLEAGSADEVAKEITESELRAYLRGKRALCARGLNQTGFEEALRRANLRFSRFDEYFAELPLAYGSNVTQTLKNAASSYSCLLYAWGELRYLAHPAKKNWKVLFQGDAPAAAVARFKKAVLRSASSAPSSSQAKVGSKG